MVAATSSLCLLATLAAGGGEARFAVSIEAREPTPDWHAEALEQSLIRDLASSERLRPAGGAEADVVLVGELEGRTLRFTTSASWTGAEVTRTELDLDELGDPAALRRAAFRAIAPFTETGGLLDQRAGAEPALRDLPPLAPWLGGLAFGWLLVLLLRLVFPFIDGVERIGHSNLFPLVGAWLSTSLGRGLLVAGWLAPIVLALVWLAGVLGADRRLAVLVAAPSAGLAGVYLLLLLVGVLSAGLDRRLVQGPATRKNPWHAVLRQYYVSQARRVGLAVDEVRLEQVLFLPGHSGQGIELKTYGGGLKPARIVVGAELLELALGDLDESIPRRDRPPELDRRELGVVVPGGKPEDAGRRPLLGLGWAERRPLRVPEPPRHIGQNTTVLGTVVPMGKGETLPLIANDEADLRVVEGMLTEHYAAFGRAGYDDDHDDTDPSHKDFLFGALLREVGAVRRSDGLFATFAHALADVASPRRWSTMLTRPIRRLLDDAQFLSDSYAVLNQGRHHLLQYVALRHFSPEEASSSALLTAHADRHALLETSYQLLQQLEGDPRVRRLGRYFHPSLLPSASRRARLTALAVAALVVAVPLAALIASAVAYHPVYEERLEAQRAALRSIEQEGRVP